MGVLCFQLGIWFFLMGVLGFQLCTQGDYHCEVAARTRDVEAA